MTQEEKELLLRDLCARLPYRPIVYVDENLPSLKLGPATRVWEYIAIDKPCKPYLRPMSSMTEEENKEAKENGCIIYWDTSPEDKGLLVLASPRGFDWLNKKMFDYHKDDEGKTMIEKGLALEAPEGMYDIKEKKLV